MVGSEWETRRSRPSLSPVTALARSAWAVLALNILTIIGGTVVRATGSGAGCGQHWPACHGELIPGFDEVATLIEFSHRVVSGLALIAVISLAFVIRRRFASGASARRWAFWSVIAILGEAAIGAWLVLAELVADNDSVLRAISVPVHLVMTFVLLGSLTLLGWTLTTGRETHWGGPHTRSFVIGGVGLLVLGATGAVTALADTLFPAESLAEGIAADLAAEHFLTTLRVIHPFVAVGVAWYVMWFANRVRDQRAARFVSMLVLVQFVVGLLNIVFLTPIWSQVVHLLLADLLWVSWVVLGADLMAEQAVTTEA